MNKPSKILHLEDKRSDSDLIKRELDKSDISFEYLLVTNKISFEKALTEFNPDLILSDYALPSFDGGAAFYMSQKIAPHIPFIIVSGTIGEEKAVELIKNGVVDYVLKNKLFKLPPKIKRALKEAEDKKEIKRLQKAFEIERQQFYDLFSKGPSSMGILGGPDHKFEMANPLYFQLIGKKDIIGKSVKEVLPEVEAQGFIEILDSVYQTGKAFSANEMIIELDVNNTGKPVDKYLNFRYQPRIGSDGKPDGILFFVVDVTEQVMSRKRIEESKKALQQSEARLKGIISSQTSYLLRTDLQGNYTYCNQKFMADFGWLHGDDNVELIGVNCMVSIMPYHHQAVKHLVEKCFANPNQVFQIEIDKPAKNNGVKTTLWDFILLTDKEGRPEEIQCAGIDISERKKAEKEITAYKMALDQSSIVAITDQKGIIKHVNDNFSKISKYSADELIGQDHRIINSGHHPKSFIRDLWLTIANGKIWRGEMCNNAKDGTTYWVDTTIVPFLDEHGKPVQYMAIRVDITQRKKAELELKQLNERLQKQTIDLEISNVELEQFAYAASHDLQEPLRMVTSFLSQLEKKYGDVIDDKGKQYIHFAVDGAKRMRQIILDLLEFSKVGKTEDELEFIKLNDLLDEVKLLLRKPIEEKSATISIDQLPEISSHRTPLRQVFQNLISNALKYSNKEIPVQINITAKEFNDHWLFAVSDNGIGIEKEYFEKIFILFQRLHNKDEYSGTGMGLAITSKIIGTLGGKIWVESEIGKGSSFYFTLKK